MRCSRLPFLASNAQFKRLGSGSVGHMGGCTQSGDTISCKTAIVIFYKCLSDPEPFSCHCLVRKLSIFVQCSSDFKNFCLY